MVGTTISHYKVLEKIGEGGMGEVYRAIDKNLDHIVQRCMSKDPEDRWQTALDVTKELQ